MRRYFRAPRGKRYSRLCRERYSFARSAKERYSPAVRASDISPPCGGEAKVRFRLRRKRNRPLRTAHPCLPLRGKVSAELTDEVNPPQADIIPRSGISYFAEGGIHHPRRRSRRGYHSRPPCLPLRGRWPSAARSDEDVTASACRWRAAFTRERRDEPHQSATLTASPEGEATARPLPSPPGKVARRKARRMRLSRPQAHTFPAEPETHRFSSLFSLLSYLRKTQKGIFSQSIQPRRNRSSAVSMPPPAAPRRVLWDSPTNFQSNSESSRSRPADTPMPP